MADSTMTLGADRKRVLILDINSGEHHPTYIRWLLEADLPNSIEIVLSGRPELFGHPEVLAAPHRFEPHPMVVGPTFEARRADFTPVSLMWMSWTIGRHYRQTFREVRRAGRIDLVIVPFLDDCLLGLAQPNQAFDGVPWLAITMRTMFHYPAMGIDAPLQTFSGLRRFLLGRVLRQRSLRALFTIDPTLASFAESRDLEYEGKILHLPDPSTFHPALPTRCEARASLGIPETVPLIVLYGEISARKGVTALLEAVADPRCVSQMHVLLAGRCRERDRFMDSSAFRALRTAGRLHSIDHYVSSEEECLLLAAGDCFWVGYTGFYGMSGIMVLAGRHGVPVMASQEGLIGYLTKQHDLGFIVNPKDTESVVGALNRLAGDLEVSRKFGKNGARHFQTHDPCEFQRIVREQVCGALRLG